MIHYKGWKDLNDTVHQLVGRLPIDEIVGVVGVPRSGMVPATMLATALNVPLASLDYFVETTQYISPGSPFYKGGGRSGKAPGTGKVVLLEDSAYTGVSLQSACLNLGGQAHEPFKYKDFEIIPAACYSSLNTKFGPYLYGEIFPTNPKEGRIFAWNWNNSWITPRTMFDMDGVLCRDPVSFEDDNDPDPYLTEIATLRPLYIPGRRIFGIATNRLESRREITQAWLKKYNVDYGSLLMRDFPTAQERREDSPYGMWKAKVYKESEGALLYVESDPRQATVIATVSGKPVLCPTDDRLRGGG